jgi:hypothetical protein
MKRSCVCSKRSDYQESSNLRTQHILAFLDPFLVFFPSEDGAALLKDDEIEEKRAFAVLSGARSAGLEPATFLFISLNQLVLTDSSLLED